MRLAGLAFALLSVGCHDHGSSGAILVNDASDEVFTSMEDLEAQGSIEVDDSEAATLTMPQDGAAVPAATVPTFSWTLPSASGRAPRHGMATGTFFWLKFTGAGVDGGEVDVFAANTMTWTPSAGDWGKLASATGTVTVRVVTAVFDDAVLVEGPWRPSADATFTVQR